MKDEIPLSRTIVERVPKSRRKDTESNIRWIANNLSLSFQERLEVKMLLHEREYNGK